MESKEFKTIWVDSRVEGVGSSWYYGGCDEMTLDELQSLLDKHNAIVYYEGNFYDNVKDIPLHLVYHSIDEFGMPTGRYTTGNPTVTVVPKGTIIVNPLGYSNTKKFRFPEGSLKRSGRRPDRNWRKDLELA